LVLSFHAQQQTHGMTEWTPEAVETAKALVEQQREACRRRAEDARVFLEDRRWQEGRRLGV
jgi:hypothetical protein